MIIAHLVLDEKFIDFFYNQVKEIQHVEHRFFILVQSHQSSFTHIKTTPIYAQINQSIFNIVALQKELSQCDAIIIHGMTHIAILAIFFTHQKKPIMWSGWGADYYYLLPGGVESLYLPKTKQINQSLVEQKGIKERFKAPLTLIKKIVLRNILTPLMLKKVDFFSAPLPIDYHKLQKALPSFKPTYLQLNYGNVEETFLTGISNEQGSNILVGNSASLTNNHLDTFYDISNLNIENRKIITPLSYGDEVYKKRVLEEGTRLFDDNFFPLTEFISLEKYNSLLSTCSIAIMNHLRQQALGNIGALLYAGKKVYLNEKSPVLAFFREKKAFVFSTCELTVDNPYVFTPLKPNEIQFNRKVLAHFWGEEVVKKNALTLIESLRNKVME